MKPEPMLTSERRRVVRGPFLVAMAVACLAIFLAASAERRDRERTHARVQAELLELVTLHAEKSSAFLDRVDQSLKLAKFVYERDPAGFLLSDLLAGGHLNPRDILKFGFADAQGLVRQSSLPMGASPVSITDREHFRGAADGERGLHIGKPILGRLSSVWMIQLTRRVERRDGEFAGIVAASVDAEAFGEGTIMALIGEDGQMRARAHLRPEMLGVDRSIDRSMARFRADPSGVLEEKAPSGGYFIAWRKLDDYPLYAIAAEPTANLAAEVGQRMRFYWAAAGLTALATLAGAVFAVRRQRRHDAALAAAHAATAQKTRLLVSLSAELRRPVDVLRWSIDTLADPPDEAARRRALADLRLADAALGRAVNDAAELARLMRESKELDLRAVDTRVFARGVFEIARAQAGGVGVTCDLALDLPDGLRILADETRLRRVTDALLGHALDRAGRGGRVGLSVGARGLDARNVEIAIAVSASGESNRPPAPESGMVAALAQAMGGRIERLASPGGTLDVFKVGFARAA